MDGDGIWGSGLPTHRQTLSAGHTDLNLTLIQCIRRERNNAILYKEYICYGGRPLMKDLLADQGYPA
jgi:hypothetical protein